MSSRKKSVIDMLAAARPVNVDNRIALPYYFRVADNILKQATIFREEGNNVVDLYIMLLRFSSLIAETIPFHQDYSALDHKTKTTYKKKLLQALNELDDLKPKVEHRVNELNKQSPKAPCESGVSSSGSPALSIKVSSGIWGAGPGVNNIQHNSAQSNASPTVETLLENPIAAPIPSAPPIEDLVIDDSPINSSSADSSVVTTEEELTRTEERRESIFSNLSCTICLDAPVEGACVPCGHMAGCISCLNEIKSKNWGCPVCRAKIELVLRLYAV